MQPSNRSPRILQPAKPWFINMSLVLAFCANLLPTARIPGIPDWVALVLAFWCVRETRHVGQAWGFVLGLLMDVADGAAFGQHALAYVIIAYGAAGLSRRILWFTPASQALHVLPLLLIAQVVMLLIRLAAGGQFPGFLYFFSSFVATLLWPALTVLLLLPQYQPLEKDDTRPI